MYPAAQPFDQSHGAAIFPEAAQNVLCHAAQCGRLGFTRLLVYSSLLRVAECEKQMAFRTETVTAFGLGLMTGLLLGVGLVFLSAAHSAELSAANSAREATSASQRGEKGKASPRSGRKQSTPNRRRTGRVKRSEKTDRDEER